MPLQAVGPEGVAGLEAPGVETAAEPAHALRRGSVGEALRHDGALRRALQPAMMVPYTGDVDVDFAAGMIPHHQAAIDMAKIQLEFGTDPGMRELAEAIIAAQESEIATLKAFLATKGM